MIPSQTHCSPLYPLCFMNYEKDACKIDPVFDPYKVSPKFLARFKPIHPFVLSAIFIYFGFCVQY